MKKIALITIASFATLANVVAQTTGELLLMSKYNFGISTARSAAMGGAFTSLGADMSSMSINPAGLAMYKNSEISISPSLRFSTVTNDYTIDGISALGNTVNNSKMTIGSLGAVYVVDGLTFGVGYNRLADFYSNSTSYGTPQNMSITDMYAEQLYGIDKKHIGIPENDIYRAFYDYPPVMWGAILGYQTGVVDPFNGQDNVYTSLLNRGDIVYPVMHRKTSGAIDEFTFSGAYNHNDILYVGATVGIQNIIYNKFDTYSEDGVKGNTGNFGFAETARNLRMSGTGFNIKIGATVRPVDWFRFGISYHTPTWISMHEEYDENTLGATASEPNKSYYSDTPIFINDYNMSTPSRLLAGASFTIANRVIVSVDYQRVWYKGMKYSQNFGIYSYRPEVTATVVDNYDALDQHSAANGDVDLNPIIASEYRATNNFSAGIEGQIFKGAFVRLGYMYQDSPYSDPELHKYGTLNQYSAGLGYRNRQFSVDLAFVSSQTKQLPHKYYYYSVQDHDPVTPLGWADVKNVVNNVILTFAFRF